MAGRSNAPVTLRKIDGILAMLVGKALAGDVEAAALVLQYAKDSGLYGD